MQKDLELSGFVANAEKSIWDPVQLIEWLGFVWNLHDCTIEIPSRKFAGLKCSIANVIEEKTHFTCRNAAKIF